MVPAIWKRATLLWVLLLAACTIQLAPSYDQALVEGLDEANTDALTLFAAVETGSPAARFGEFETRYATLIGRFDALQQRADNREVPPLAARLSRLGFVRNFCRTESTDSDGCVNVSPRSLAVVVSVLRRMRDRHRSDGLPRDIVENFRNAYNTAITQALTVENALKR